MQKAMTILYKVGNNLYVNLTNRCPCACTFCIRQNRESVYETKDSLWLEREPSFEEVKSAFKKLSEKTGTLDQNEIVFCGYGEPTEALDVLLQTADFVKAQYKKPVRLNTNGLGNLINKKDITPLFKDRIDAVSVSLNSSDPAIYMQRVRPSFGERSFEAMLDFTKKCLVYVPSVTMSTVSTTITPEDEKACAELCKNLGVSYRIREFAR